MVEEFAEPLVPTTWKANCYTVLGTSEIVLFRMLNNLVACYRSIYSRQHEETI